LRRAALIEFMSPHRKLTGLVAAAHTPFTADGALNLSAVEKLAAHFLNNKITRVFVAGSTGESHSLSFDERRRLAQRWSEVARGTPLAIIIHAGSNCLADARALAAHAQQIGAVAVAALAPSYFKPRTVAGLIDCCAFVASAAPELPFYFYDIPALTGVSLAMPEFLAQGRRKIPNLAGIKWTNADLYAYQLCQHAPGDFDLPWGNDEYLLAALALGATGAVGSTFCFAAPVYHRLLKNFAAGRWPAARKEQFRACQIVQTLAGCGYLGAAKAVMKMLGVDVGPARLPNTNPTAAQRKQLRAKLETLGFFDWIKI
jgi:N-acetylneuraminate lyase